MLASLCGMSKAPETPEAPTSELDAAPAALPSELIAALAALPSELKAGPAALPTEFNAAPPAPSAPRRRRRDASTRRLCARLARAACDCGVDLRRRASLTEARGAHVRDPDDHTRLVRADLWQERRAFFFA